MNLYAGQFTRPTGAAANNVYNLSDFVFGYQSQYGLSNILVADMRQQMHFAYVQDDFRITDALTVNAGLRYEYATPQWEANNVLSNFDPVALTMIPARDGSVEDRSTIQPDRNNLGAAPRLRLVGDAVDRGARRLRHLVRALPARWRRQHPGHQRSAGDQRGRRPERPDARPRSARSRTASRSAGTTRPTSTRWRPTSPTCPATTGRAASTAGTSRCSASCCPAPSSTSPTSATGRTACCSSPTTTRRDPTPSARTRRCRHGGRSRRSATSRTRGTAGARTTTASSSRRRRAPAGFYFVNALTLSRARDSGAGSLENPNGNSPAVQDFNNVGAEYAISGYNQPYNWTSSVVWDVPVGRDRRYLSGASALVDAAGRRLAGGLHQPAQRR